MRRLISFSLLAALSVSVVQAAGYSGYWLHATPGRAEASECSLFNTEPELINELKKIHWNDGFPAVNWKTDVAVVMAPSQSKLGWSLTLFEVLRQGNDAVVSWGWYLPEQTITTTTTTNAIIIGAGSKQAFVVALPRVSGTIRCEMR